MSGDDFSGVFAPLADEAYFALASIREGVVVWPNSVDIAPDAMYSEVRDVSLKQLRGAVLRDDNPTDPVWPLDEEASLPQRTGTPVRRPGALAGRVTIAPDFDAPIDLTPPDDTIQTTPRAGTDSQRTAAMRVFVDTEYTDFIDCDLISIGLVADDGREFYGERSDYDQASCSQFVRAAVLPQLGQYPGQVFMREALRVALLAWLAQFARQPERVLCFDYGGDWELLCDLLDGPPTGWQAHHVGQLLDPGRTEDYYREHRGRHHALVDARANRFAVVDIESTPDAP